MHNHNSSHSSPASKGQPHIWQDGDIAFLRACHTFSLRDYNDLIASGHLQEKATCHPVIILKAHCGRAIITPVTAFGSGAENDFLPPWQQAYHRQKSRDDFRAFVGTRKPNNRHDFLRLADPKMQMPKPQASWVYLGNFYTVPYTVLGRFNKTSSLLQVANDSLAQLRQDIKRKYGSQLQDALDRLGAAPAVTPAPAPAPKNPPQALAAAPAPRAVRQVAWGHAVPECHPAPATAACPQQGTGVAVMTYSKVVSGTAGAVLT